MNSDKKHSFNIFAKEYVPTDYKPSFLNRKRNSKSNSKSKNKKKNKTKSRKRRSNKIVLKRLPRRSNRKLKTIRNMIKKSKKIKKSQNQNKSRIIKTKSRKPLNKLLTDSLNKSISNIRKFSRKSPLNPSARSFMPIDKTTGLKTWINPISKQSIVFLDTARNLPR